jgi:hypothetical protein
MAVRKTEKGAALKRWFKEDWKDVRTGKACGAKKVKNAARRTADRASGSPRKLRRPRAK